MPRFARPRHATVVAYLALFVALGGSSYAAFRVTGKDVKDHSLTARDIKRNSLTSATVRNGSLQAKDFRAGQLPAGPRGPLGPQGLRGPQGAPGQTGQTGPQGPAGTARAYALVDCSGSPPPFVDCTLHKARNVAYAVNVAPGVYCVGADGIQASDPDAIAIVAPADGRGGASAQWQPHNSACVASEFEVDTFIAGTINVRNYNNTGTQTVSLPDNPLDAAFVIAIP